MLEYIGQPLRDDEVGGAFYLRREARLADGGVCVHVNTDRHAARHCVHRFNQTS